MSKLLIVITFYQNPNRGERSNQSRLATPSSLQKPKTRLSFAPKTPQEPVHVKPTTQESAPNEPTSQFSAAQSKPAPIQSTEPAADELKMPQIAAPTVEPTPIRYYCSVGTLFYYLITCYLTRGEMADALYTG